MSKYDVLWQYIKSRDEKAFKLTFDEIADILGFQIDHSFLNYKKDLAVFGYQVEKISLKEHWISFRKTEIV
ncbi:MAG: hypothetical protein GX415_05255 [Chloroflexi bacterium]|jgi:hypothetical protein|nr:hypothetical protein [Anaerolineaceae bacterium]NLI44801.1 hypothetical protein [Chloroflexota bacterium]HOE35493.1 hypothetical protein [Anaerolineaceae bacterium]HOT26156.1 hypothetical protein [Anaerolineaceae bacterium]HQH58478.1 hypothetical protein [Anaerolineaceae bacterium]